MKRLHILKAVLILAAMSLLLLSGCGGNIVLKQYKEVTADAPTATIKTTMGDIKVVLFPKEAPKAVENFITLAKDGKYNGIRFHRVINDFMVQGGDTDGLDGMGGQSKWGTPFEDEFSDNLWNFRGALSMANSGENTNGSQFFIVQAPASTITEDFLSQMKAAGWPAQVIDKYKENGGTPWLDKKHTVFGQVIEGMDVIDAMVKVKTDSNDKPLEDILINSIEVKEASK
ncbi:peptidylprolyl isomerase [Acetanaerobacterium elongatum]|uniref:Peptidyl-prolyl cis-trans isomerase n=1 Tax=Acetanaerobacterium elongatum TaxID=258515 RepID=A0A1H0D344_9FIRM|nr:peptidylprolyl isomerase [Acetanaerobacterium elongatum]SDN64583.1 peptidyl-prolyl cis-trans isomerase B (cyclophilin B) [Acetanaerobacterium elongatum]